MTGALILTLTPLTLILALTLVFTLLYYLALTPDPSGSNHEA